MANSTDLAELVKQENARVSILNGSSVSGLAASTTDYLKSQGINVVETGNAGQLTPATEITFFTGKPYTLKYLVDMMGISPYRIRHLYDPSKSADIEIIAGDDWAQSGKLP